VAFQSNTTRTVTAPCCSILTERGPSVNSPLAQRTHQSLTAKCPGASH
jgi:hypothetical protein